MPKAIRIAAILLLVLAGVLAVLAFGLGRKAPAPNEPTARSAATPATPRRAVVVATRALAAGQPIHAGDLSTTELPVAAGDGFARISDVDGHVPAIDITAGAMIVPGQLLQGIAAGIKPGERAISVPVDELAGVSNRVTPGDYVDVFMSLQAPAQGTTGRNDNTQARLLLSRLRVLGYGDDDVGKAHPAAASNGDDAAGTAPEPGSRAETIASRSSNNASSSNGGTQARSAILAVPVEDAGRLLLAAHTGKLFLALRNPGDTALADTAIFAAPAPVLALRRDLDSEAASAAERPENRAYAGIDLLALAGDNPAKPNPATRAAAVPARSRDARPAARPSIEIIRGTTPSNRLSSP